MASPSSTWCPKPEISTGMEMQRLSKGAEEVSRDVGFTGSPGGDVELGSGPSEPPGLQVGSGGAEQKGARGGVSSKFLGTGRLGKAIPVGPWD